MREILFRGKKIERPNVGEWVYGYYVHNLFPRIDHMEHRIFTGLSDGPRMQRFDVDPETIGQYTGLKDKNGKRIFEGDILRCADAVGCVCFGTYASAYESKDTHIGFYIKWYIDRMLRIDLAFWANEREPEVIGNIHDNPELLEVEG